MRRRSNVITYFGFQVFSIRLISDADPAAFAGECVCDLARIFGSNLRHYRKAHGLKQHELAERLGVSLATIGKIERGEAAPSFDTIEKIAAALAVPAAALFGGGTDDPAAGERGRLLQRVLGQLSKLNDDALARASRVIRAMTE
jgi:transcriptional regulator with XRE-family HTH domain